jgi:outer membrane immunogenic protein
MGGFIMKRFLFGSMALVALGMSAPAMAADMPVKVKAPPPVVYYDWSGLYVGFSIGWSEARVDRGYFNGLTCAGLPCDFRTTNSDLVYDVHFGVQGHWMWGGWWGVVLGIEGGLTGFHKENIGFSAVFAAPPFLANTTGWHKIDTIYQVGPRLGLTFDRWMIYGTGGWASANVDAGYAINDLVLLPPNDQAGSVRAGGWFAGGGLEYMIHKGSLVDVMLGAEYTHYEFDRKTAFCSNAACTGLFSYDTKAEVDVVRARLTIKTHGWDIF